MKSIGFKEWALVCQALGNGSQSVLLRKGGIAEGRDGFAFAHDQFFLFPTFFHEQIANVRTDERELPAETGGVTLRFYAEVERALWITSPTIAESLSPLHVISAGVVRDRFQYKKKGLNVAFVRVFELAKEWAIPPDARYAGCRSWVQLPAPPEVEIRPVLSADTQARRRAEFDSLVDRANR